ncbi:MAG: hypothetical protein IPM29_32315 [Planctomycetes bacterium]|nr:hypothetical protein [Planctomycetota bacterium]
MTFETRNGDELIRAKKQNATGKAPVVLPRQADTVSFLRLSLDTYERAKHVAAGHDIYFLYEQWKAACRRSGEHIRNPDKAFLAYCAAAAGRSTFRRVS